MNLPLILLHGALGSEEQLFSLQKTLSQTREVYTLNFEGHGDFKSQNKFSIALFRENVFSFIKDNNLNKVNIFGFSMGGYVALNLASNYPALVNSIITLGTKFSWNPSFASLEIQKLNPKKIKEKVPGFAARLEYLHGREWQNVVLNTASLMRDLGDNPPLQENDFNKIDARTLICLGELDEMSTVEESEKSTELLPNATFKLLKDFKHPIEMVPVDELATIINTFLNNKI